MSNRRNRFSRCAKQHRGPATRGLTPGTLTRLAGLVAALMGGVAFAVTSVQADEIMVPQDFPTIQAAVDAAIPGTTIKVRRGTYTEEIVIAKNLNFRGDGVHATRLRSPSALTPFTVFLPTGAPMAAVVLITNGAKVRMSGLTITGPTPCDVEAGGIAVIEGARLELEKAHVRRMRPEPANPNACSPGGVDAAIRIGLPAAFSVDGQMGSTGHGRITDVRVSQYLGTGISVGGPPEGAASTATISNNVILGDRVPFPVAGQNSIAIRQNSLARVTKNTVGRNVCTDTLCGPDPINEFQSVGIVAVDVRTRGNEISDNHVFVNDIGIGQFESPNCCTIRENRIRNNRFFGIVIQDGHGTTVENIISGGQVGIAVVAGSADTVGVLRGDEIRRTSLMPIQEISSEFTATAIVEDD